MTDKLAELLSKCKCGVFLTVNEHRDYYQAAEDRLDDLDSIDDATNLSPEIRQKCIETDTIIELQFYPRSPISSYLIIHYDLNAALDEALMCLAKERYNG